NGDSSPYATALAERLPALLEPSVRINDVFAEAAEAVGTATRGRQSPAQFLQGALPTLSLDAADDQRRAHGIRLLPPAVPWRRIGLIAAAAVAIAAAGTGAWAWANTLPEEHMAFLARLGLAHPELVDLTCTPPWDGR